MKHKVNTVWKEKMQFNSVVNGHNLTIDAASEFGGENAGPRPKELMLTALTGCTAMDVIAILNKMKLTPEHFEVRAEAELTQEHPKHYTSIHLVYYFKGKNLPFDKLKHAIELSQDKYCGVSFMYKKFLNLTYEIQVDEA